ncbi:interleukin-12 subunit beta isoform X2 [Lepisosteus oculatus]|nr:PREDICTED: interleukin-12 subunit beta [Lepisosteus oculatus]
MTCALQLFCVLLLALQQARSSDQEEPSKYWVFRPNVIVLDVDLTKSTSSHVELSCGEAHQLRDVHWKKDNRKLRERGNVITVEVVEMFGGNYTCHDSSGATLNHTLVLVQETNNEKGPFPKTILKNEENNYITCKAKNYSGDFECSWQLQENREDATLFVSAERLASSEVSSISCTMDEHESKASCQDSSFCPYREERDRINFTLYATHLYRFEEYSKVFYIHEILKPDSPENLKVCRINVTWDYPANWKHSRSYFPLTFQVKVVKGSCDSLQAQPTGTDEATSLKLSKKYRHKGNSICVRAKDMFCDSAWSDWKQANHEPQRRKRNPAHSHHRPQGFSQ